jgi:hypothetical protein
MTPNNNGQPHHVLTPAQRLLHQLRLYPATEIRFTVGGKPVRMMDVQIMEEGPKDCRKSVVTVDLEVPGWNLDWVKSSTEGNREG